MEKDYGGVSEETPEGREQLPPLDCVKSDTADAEVQAQLAAAAESPTVSRIRPRRDG